MHRQIYALLGAVEPEKRRDIELLLFEAYQMAKRMNRRLRQHQRDYAQEFFEDAGPE